jgi:xylan 1,4-beta-xylosidase
VTQLEHSPPGVMRTRALEARAAAGRLPLYYTEWSISSNPRDPMHDSAFAAALAVRIAMSVDDVVDGYSWWTFSDIFEENYFPSVPFHGGFGLMNLYGVPKPVYRAFQMLRALGTTQIPVVGEHPTVAGWAAHDADGTRAVLINQAMPRHAVQDEPVSLQVKLPAGSRPGVVTLARIDSAHADPAEAWRKLGAPDYLKPAEVEALMRASEPTPEPIAFASADGLLRIETTLAAQSVNQLRIEWESAA